MKITFIRHTSVDVPKGTCYGQTDVPLKDSFPQEATLAKEKYCTKPFQKAYVSPLSRCTKLANFCGYADAIKDERILELNFGDWEMKQFDNITDERIQEWFKDYIHVAPTNGESFIEQYNRVCSFIEDLKKEKEENVVVFTHGGVIVSAQIYAKKYKMEEAFKGLIPHGEGITLEF